ncbi:hypothetical protein F7D01_05065 [Erythrobacter sp. 3-20A1M]|uniref:hypothetical protein n=1 Tax=Erythrobacter sp. 3-20A1M TaxID=2653850 RepID=UPI001BFBFA83|nr:hypothetical protein [Erythrobacter sp. 3-20A1M]QWC56546.1 hypothetical protein F7D01_05065 [Erythrobacter sp. 3-20A1M]
MLKAIHPLAGALALFLIGGFWLSTVTVELIGTLDQIASVKMAIPWFFLVLVPAMMAAGGSGQRLAAGFRNPRIATKRRRMIAIASNGILILMPSAIFLALEAGEGAFDRSFYVVQTIELVAGAVNIALLGLNMRDGWRLVRNRPGQRKART